VLASIFVSLIFDASIYYPEIEIVRWTTIEHFYPLLAVSICGLAYTTFFHSKNPQNYITRIIVIIGPAIIAIAMLNSDLKDPTTNGQFTSLEYIVKILLALVFFWYAIVHNDTRDFIKSSFFWFSTIWLIHSCSGIVIFSMFNIIKESVEMQFGFMYLNWFLNLSASIAFAYVFFALGKKGWSTDLY